eukprot:Gregarina_sp_Poly_1__8308@NODE_485_length_8010_cov_1032_836460_g392_i0_p1_GENE_NODE_485_length_8010_cov_1032_836460_g392_i0NODE_485_length_8010_cov_1032_836460_g392_i0_p1_ORF_typecomplete_len1428_score205_17DEAD/PF00270_29/2_2e20DEAD/PF00270_29/50Helicase_C/PF00271_31/87Helicase_C/PF00271_31/2_1e19ResIII/PF04851_15/2_7e12ResIII/PF04851_15/1_2e04B12binding/PF02310_19/5_4B12binding/PF02310_19/62_NODE_485_length_8010_cov_1032_836460_g392_i09115194
MKTLKRVSMKNQEKIQRRTMRMRTTILIMILMQKILDLRLKKKMAKTLLTFRLVMRFMIFEQLIVVSEILVQEHSRVYVCVDRYWQCARRLESPIFECTSMKQLRRTEVRRRSLQLRNISQSYSLNSGSKSRYKLSTPLRQLKTGPFKSPLSQAPSSKTASTPLEIRWPLVAFFKKHKYSDVLIRLLGNDSLQEQNQLLIDLEDIENTISLLQDRQKASNLHVVDFDIVHELKTQYIRAALKDSGPNVKNLKLCLQQYLESSRMQLQRQSVLYLPPIPESPSVSVSVSETEPASDHPSTCTVQIVPSLPCTPYQAPSVYHKAPPPSVVLPVESSYSPTPQLLSHTPAHRRTLSPMQTPSLPATKASSSGVSHALGDTPLDLVKQRLLTVRRLQVLKKLCEQTSGGTHGDIMLRAQNLIGKLDTSRPTSGSKRRLGLEMDFVDGKKRKVTLEEADVSTADQSGDANDSAGHTDTHSPMAANRVQKTKLRGAESLLGAKAVPRSKKKYVSRVAATQKARYTRETRAVRESLHGHAPVNKTRRQRRNDKLKQIQESKFVAKSAIDLEALKEHYRAKVDTLDSVNDELFNGEQTSRNSDCTSCTQSTNIESEEDIQYQTSSSQLETQLEKFFKLKAFKVGQLTAIQKVLHATNIRLVVSLPTGFGKSLVFQMSALNLARTRKELTIAIFPTLPLLADQFNKLSQLSILACGAVHSGIKPEEIRQTLFALKNGLLDIVMVTPEQYNSKKFQFAIARLKSRKIGLVCVDESHCLSEWGHTFRPAYQKVLKNSRTIPRVLLMTATASEATLESMKGYVEGSLEVYKPISSTQRTDLRPKILGISNSSLQPSELINLLKRLKKHKDGVVLIYCWMKHVTEKIARLLKEEFVDTSIIYYHSGMDDEERNRAIQCFVEGTCDYCVATEALGIGIDSLHVWTVIHYNVPGGLEQYTQEIGRCNRGAQWASCSCHLLFNVEDFRTRYCQASASIVDSEAVMDCFLRLLCRSCKRAQGYSTRRSTCSGPSKEEKGKIIDLRVDAHSSPVSKMLKAQSPAIVISGLPVKGLSSPCLSPASSDCVSGNNSPNASKCSRTAQFEECVTVSIDASDLGYLMNSRSVDETHVFVTLLDNLATKNSVSLRISGRRTEWDVTVDDWRSVLRYYENSTVGDGTTFETNKANPDFSRGADTADIKDECNAVEEGYEMNNVSELKIFQSQSEGVELRCYSKPLEDWIESNSFVRLLSKFWTRNSSGVYKMKWVDFLTQSELSPLVVDIDIIEHSISDLANDLHCSVTPISRGKKIWMRFMRSRSSVKYIKSLVKAATKALETNNRIQINRLNASYVAFKLGLGNYEKMMQFIEDYFKWPCHMECCESDATLWSNERVRSFSVDQTWIQEPFEKKPAPVALAQLKFDIEKLVFTLTRDGRLECICFLHSNE